MQLRAALRALPVLLLFGLLPVLSHRSKAQTPPTQALTFAASADSYVDAGSPTTNFNTAVDLKADASPVRVIYLRFVVTGVNGRSVQRARLRMQVTGASSVGGTVHKISNTTWNEATLNFNNKPAVDGAGLSTLAAVTAGAVIEWNVDAAVTGDGVYSFAIDSTSSSAAAYASNAATTGQKPQLVLNVAAAPPTIAITTPPAGSTFVVGDTITLQATAADANAQNLSGGVTWRSDVAGALGTGAIITPTLAQGTHTITASVTDGQGLTAQTQIILTVAPRPPVNTEPLVAITAPGDNQMVPAGLPVTFTGTANDLEDGSLTASLGWSSDRDGALGTGGAFTHALSAGTHHITASVTDHGGLTGTATITVQVQPSVTIEFPAVADAHVDAGFPTTNFGANQTLRVDANTERITYLRFNVTGVGARPIAQAFLRVQTDPNPGADSDSGGTAYSITNGTWQEGTITYATRPAVDGPILATAGAVTLAQVVDFDVSRAVTGDGTYNFALKNSSADEATYQSREGGAAPKLVLLFTGNAPTVTITAPAAGAVAFRNDAISFVGTARDVEDGNLASRLQWSSDRDGSLGSGAALSVSRLSVGTHVITASATDSDGLT